MKLTNLYKSCGWGKIHLEISFAGCEHHCKGCYVPELQDPTFFPDWPKEYIFREIEKLEPFVEGFILLGGDPLYPANIEDSITLISHLKKYKKPITMLTGYTEEEISKHERRKYATSLCDKVLAGRFIPNEYKQLRVKDV